MLSVKDLENIANVLRRDSLISTTEAGSGHPTSCLSCAEIMSALFFYEMCYDVKNPYNPDNDEFILSKGHAAPILYSALKHAGCIKADLTTLRKLTSPLEGHPVPNSLKWIKVGTGSLGQGLSAGIGMALAMKMQKRKSRVYVLMGDSELAEGSVYESLNFASYYKLNNIVVIVDINRLGQTGETMYGYDLDYYDTKFSSFGWNSLKIDGHDIKEILNAFKKAGESEKPTIILAKTVKGNGVSFLENKNGWHGKALSKWELESALNEIPYEKIPKININNHEKVLYKPKLKSLKKNIYKIGELVSTRESYGKALLELSKSDSRVIAVDSEVGNSTESEYVKKNFGTKNQFIQNYIAEQNMIGISLGLSKLRMNPFPSTFAVFLTRTYDQLRMASLSSANFTVCGSHAGISIGEDGASQMGLEDISLFRTLPNSVIFYPSDAVSAEKLVFLSYKLKGIKYLRTTRPKTPVIYKNSEKFKVGDFKVLKKSKKDRLVLAGSGITLHESLKAYEELNKKEIAVAVVDLYSIKPFNSKKFIKFVKRHGNKIVVSEDHHKEGGIGEMLAGELKSSGIKIMHLYVEGIPHSGTKEELLHKYNIDSESIIKSAISLK
ncbi:transketolase [Candidatus Pacearchaeota archaeon]|nr:transketolase [Candidatus Pacearchaeota archaeon]